MSVTSNTLVEEYPEGSGRPVVPKDPYHFGKALQYSQTGRYKHHYTGEQRILFNKGRYFETTIYNPEILKQVCELTDLKPEHTNMVVASWDKMEDFVIAMNILDIYVEIDIDWI